MNILHLHPGPDTGGQSMASKPALEAVGHSVRVFVHSYDYFGYPAAEKWDADLVDEAFDWADLVVVHREPDLYERVAKGRRKPVMVRHPGTYFRRSPERVWSEGDRIGAVQVVSTVDLLLSVPEGRVHWLPQCVDVPKMQAIRANVRRGTVPRIVHAPTSGIVKGTRFVTRSARQLVRKGLCTYDLIRRQPWSECLRRKAAADVFVDQLLLGIGGNGVEAWAMGIPVVAAAPPPILDRMQTEWGGLPFYLGAAEHEPMKAALRELVTDPDLRAEYARRGSEHVRRFHAWEPWVARFEGLAALATGDRLLTAA